MATPEEKAGRGTGADNAGPSADASAGGPASGADPFGMAEWLRTMPNMHPLMQHPAAAMAAATAIGLSVTGQMAGFMLGAMQGMSGRARRADEPDEGIAETAPELVEEPVKAAVPVAEPETMVPEPVTEAVVAAAPVAEVLDAPPAKVKAAAKPVRRKAVPRATEAKTDDLKKIDGIGPKLEQVLNGRGISSYRDIALWSEADVERLDGELNVGGRIVRDNWVEQAKALMKG